MYFWIKHTTFIFLFFTVPLSGWLMNKYLPKNITLYLRVICIVLLLPILTGYNYIIEIAYGCFLYLILACTYSLKIEARQLDLKAVFKFSLKLLAILGLITFMGKMAGIVVVENEWEFKNYKVEYIRDQGFSGGPLMQYQLSQYGKIPGFIKPLDVVIDNDTARPCQINFTDAQIVFDRCEGTISALKK